MTCHCSKYELQNCCSIEELFDLIMFEAEELYFCFKTSNLWRMLQCLPQFEDLCWNAARGMLPNLLSSITASLHCTVNYTASISCTVNCTMHCTSLHRVTLLLSKVLHCIASIHCTNQFQYYTAKHWRAFLETGFNISKSGKRGKEVDGDFVVRKQKIKVSRYHNEVLEFYIYLSNPKKCVIIVIYSKVSRVLKW